jgi:uncharacterized protein
MATAEADSSASLRNDKQKGTATARTTAKATADPYGMTNKRTDNGKSKNKRERFSEMCKDFLNLLTNRSTLSNRVSFLTHKFCSLETLMTTSIPSLKGTALITGASTGIGAVYADRLARRGYDLILVARNGDRLKTLAASLQSATGRTVEVLAADLTDKAALRTVEERLRSDKSITALVNNAGFGATASLVNSNIDDLENMIDLNVTALTRLTYAVLPGFLEKKRGVLINISSIAALSPEILNGVYSGTKAYVVNLTQSLNKEVKDKGVQVQAVLPGATASEFWDRAGIGGHQNLPKEIVMSSEEMVDASLAGLDKGELVTIPALPDVADWAKFDAARVALGPNLSRRHAAERYGVRV